MGEIDNKTLATISTVSLIVVLVGIISLSDDGLLSITGASGLNYFAQLANAPLFATVVITLIVNVVLLSILLRNKNS